MLNPRIEKVPIKYHCQENQTQFIHCKKKNLFKVNYLLEPAFIIESIEKASAKVWIPKHKQ